MLEPTDAVSPATSMHSCVYVYKDDRGWLYCGQTDNLPGRLLRYDIVPCAGLNRLLAGTQCICCGMRTSMDVPCHR